jgi:hypothetical protein
MVNVTENRTNGESLIRDPLSNGLTRGTLKS